MMRIALLLFPALLLALCAGAEAQNWRYYEVGSGSTDESSSSSSIILTLRYPVS